MQYHSRSSRREKSYRIDPLPAGVRRGRALPLRLRAALRAGCARSRVERIRSLTPLEETFEPVEELAEAAFPHSLGIHQGAPERVELEFAPDSGPLRAGTHLAFVADGRAGGGRIGRGHDGRLQRRRAPKLDPELRPRRAGHGAGGPRETDRARPGAGPRPLLGAGALTSDAAPSRSRSHGAGRPGRSRPGRTRDVAPPRASAGTPGPSGAVDQPFRRAASCWTSRSRPTRAASPTRRSHGGRTRLYARRLDRFETEAVPGTEGARQPFFFAGRRDGRLLRGRMAAHGVARRLRTHARRR